MKSTSNAKPVRIGNISICKKDHGYLLIDVYSGKSILVKK